MNSWLLAGGGLAALGFSARWNWWRPRAEGLPILMYHKVGTPPAGSKLKKLWVSPEQFRRQMHYLKEKGHSPITFRRLAELRDRGEAVPDSAVVITFDDGYKNNHENAFPILKEFGFEAVVFLVFNTLEGENAWHDPAGEARVPMLSWREIEELKAGGVEFGSHTLNHVKLSRVDHDTARREIQESRRALSEKLGYEPVSFAYPYGDGADEPRLQDLAREAGYRWAVSVHQGKADLSGNPFCLNRIFVRGDDTALDFHLHMTRGKSRF
ncbi:MAG: polysaccharide deacetylase family protein [Elusimicrobiota bacterium]